MMDNKEIIEKIEIAINILLSNDRWLLENDLSERSISHKLGEYLQLLFNEYNVDCEYNGDINRDNIEEGMYGRKRIAAIKNELIHYNLLSKKELEEESDKEYIERLVYPDIIIHKRGINDSNLCIIEIKKSTSIVSYDYDRIKLRSYTTNDYGNLNYQLGVFIKFITKTKNITYDLKEFENGNGPDLY